MPPFTPVLRARVAGLKHGLLALALCSQAWSQGTAPGSHPSLPSGAVPDGFGVNIHFTDPRPGELEMLAAAGFKWVRMDVQWAETETKKGEYDFSAHDRLAVALAKHQLRALFILDYGNPLYAVPGDRHPFTSRAGAAEFQAAFAKWAVAAVEHFKGRGYIWELWNEPNQEGFWRPKPEPADYAALVRATGTALRQAGLLGPKGEAFIGPATSTIDFPFIEACFSHGLLEFWDAVSVHPYRQQAPETVEEEYRRLRLLIRRYAPAGKVIPIISSEWGYSDAWDKFDREQQGNYLARQFLTNLANDVVLSIWYDWRDDGPNPKEPEHHFGVVGHEYHPGRDPVFDPKPGYTAMRTLTQQLGGFKFDKTLAAGPARSNVLLFKRGDETRLAVRPMSPPIAPGEWILPASNGAFRRTGLLGQALPEARVTNGRLTLETPELTGYLAPSAPNDQLRVAAAWGRAPLLITVRHDSPAEIVLALRNPLDRSVDVAGRTLGAGEATELTVPIPTARVDRTTEVTSTLEFAIDGGRTSFAQRTWVVPENPVTLARYPHVNGTIPVRVLNPTGVAFRGDIVQRTSPAGAFNPKEEQRLPVSLAAGVRERLVLVPMASLPENARVQVSLRDERDRLLDGRDVSREIQLSLPADLLQGVSEGAPGLKVEHEFSDAAPPGGTPFPGMPSLRLTYRFGAGWSFLRLGAPAEPLASAQEVGLWIYGDGGGLGPRLRFRDETGQVFQPRGPTIDWKGWRYVAFTLASTEEKPLEHWGGANDGIVHPPIAWDSLILFDNLSQRPLEGEIYLSAPTLIF